jgi:hypothetical protein
VSASRPDEPFRRKVVVIKDEGLVGDGAPAGTSQGTASAAPAAAAGPSPQARAGQPAGACVQARAWTRYSSGYDHLVTLQNGCAKVADCQVSTNVNPAPIRVMLPAGATETVLTFRGSPAYEFKPIVDCRVAP